MVIFENNGLTIKRTQEKLFKSFIAISNEISPHVPMMMMVCRFLYFEQVSTRGKLSALIVLEMGY